MAGVPSSRILATHPQVNARRAFLAALILATKFNQDKAYANKMRPEVAELQGEEGGICGREAFLGWQGYWRSIICRRSPFTN